MAFMNDITAPITDGELVVVRLLRHFCVMRDQRRHDAGPSQLVALGQNMHLPAIVTECCCSRGLSGDERAILHLLGSQLPTTPDTRTPDIPNDLPGVLTCAILSVRQLCGHSHEEFYVSEVSISICFVPPDVELCFDKALAKFNKQQRVDELHFVGGP